MIHLSRLTFITAFWIILSLVDSQFAFTDNHSDGGLEFYQQWIKTPEGREIPRIVRSVVENLLLHKTSEKQIPDISWPAHRVGLFLTAMKGRKVRACVGTFIPKADTLSKELLYQCKRLVTKDPRHPPLDHTEIDQLTFVVTFTTPPRTVADPERVDIFSEGLFAAWNGREAVLLPGEAKTLEWGLSYVRNQLSVPAGMEPRYARIPVVIVKEHEQSILKKQISSESK